MKSRRPAVIFAPHPGTFDENSVCPRGLRAGRRATYRRGVRSADWRLKMKKYLAAFIGAAAFYNAPVLAADLVVKVPPPAAPAPFFSWTGFYIGANIGGAWVSDNATWNPLPSPALFDANVISARNNYADVIGGIHGGFNYQIAPVWVAGIEGDWEWMAGKGSATNGWTLFGTAIPVGATALTSMTTTVDWLSSIRGRVGYLVTPNVMAYATGGVAWGRFGYNANASFSPYFSPASVTATDTGFVVGGGFEWAQTGNVIWRAEYLYYGFGNGQNVTGRGLGGALPAFPRTLFGARRISTSFVAA